MSSNIKSITIKNFKGVGESEVHVELRPITLLFGANSAGKSTILHALQFIRDVLERNNADPDRTLNGGGAVDLGGFRNAVNGRDLSKQIELAICIDLSDSSLPDLVPNTFEDSSLDGNNLWDFYDQLQKIRNKAQTASVKLILAWSKLSEQAVIIGYHIGINDDWLAEFTASSDGKDVSVKVNPNNQIFLEKLPEGETNESLLSLIIDLSESDGWTDHFDQTIGDEYSLWPEILFSVKEAGVEKPGAGLKHWLTPKVGGLKSALPRLDSLLNIPTPDVSRSENIFIAREFTSFLSSLLIGPAILARDELRKLRYIGPIREIPKRNFDANLTKDESRWSDGMAAWEALLSGSQQLVDNCSSWMSETSKLNTGYGVVRRHIKEIDIDNSAIDIGWIKPRISLTDKNNLQLQPKDVGVGISQVLPVVVAALERNASIVTIEQPELHIHPRIQVGLGDLFIHGAIEHQLSFLIETHSEYLIKRLMRRIREGTLSLEKLSVCYVQSLGQETRIIQLEIDEAGDFINDWPGGFFEESFNEQFSGR